MLPVKKIFLIVLVSATATISSIAQTIRIACIGNSITYGSGVANREKNSYPQQLQNMLGNGYQVMNFGVSGRTLLRKGNYPYWATAEFKKAIASNPDIVFIKLGTNDSKAINRPFLNEFENDYNDLIDSLRQLPSAPRIILLLPVPSFMKDSNQIYDPVIRQQIIPHIQNVAYKTGCEVIDLYSLFIDKPELLPDGIHPSSLGATIIAKRLYEAVMLNSKKSFNIFSFISEEKKISSFYGYECADFVFSNHACKVVKPKKAAEGLPWIWRARFWGHEPQTDIALLERGFHVVYCDVAELFGNKEAVTTWNKFYSYMHKAGLSKKVVLEGMSRGGMYVYNWALANPGKVACVYADAPVLDPRSWPGGKGKGPGSKEDWEIFKKDYALTEEEALQFHNSPLDNAEKIARLGFPMLHVVGDADEVVPVDENTNPFEAAVKKAGGSITVIHKAGVKHHPHSLPNPSPIVDFILRATNHKTNFATVAAPSAEYRSAAGWKEAADWWKQNSDIDSLLLNGNGADIVFLGNSITQGIGGDRPNVTYKPGLDAFTAAFKPYKWISAGISGDRTQHILWRLQHGAYATAKPKLIVVTIGVNNFTDDSAQEIAAGIAAILSWMKNHLPATKIILIGPLPAGIQPTDEKRMKYEQVQQLISRFKQTNMTYLPLSNLFIKTGGDMNTDFVSGDGIHLQAKGYEVWAAALKNIIDKELGK